MTSQTLYVCMFKLGRVFTASTSIYPIVNNFSKKEQVLLSITPFTNKNLFLHRELLSEYHILQLSLGLHETEKKKSNKQSIR